MNALEAIEKLNVLNRRIEALDVAYATLWECFERRGAAIELAELKSEIESERSALEDKLRSVSV